MVLLLGCASTTRQASPAGVGGDPHGSIRFWVYMVTPAEDALLQSWSFIPVYLVSRSGQRLLGRTDANGFVTLPKDQIWAVGAEALLFCLEDEIQCSAFRLETEWLRGFDEFKVQLPMPQVVD